MVHIKTNLEKKMPREAAFVLSLVLRWPGTKLPVARGNYYEPSLGFTIHHVHLYPRGTLGASLADVQHPW